LASQVPKKCCTASKYCAYAAWLQHAAGWPTSAMNSICGPAGEPKKKKYRNTNYEPLSNSIAAANLLANKFAKEKNT